MEAIKDDSGVQGPVELKGYVPRALRRQVKAALAMQDIPFSRWLRDHLQVWLDEVSGVKHNNGRSHGGSQ